MAYDCTVVRYGNTPNITVYYFTKIKVLYVLWHAACFWFAAAANYVPLFTKWKKQAVVQYGAWHATSYNCLTIILDVLVS